MQQKNHFKKDLSDDYIRVEGKSMKICTVISPDKLSMSMFYDFLRSFGGSVKAVDFNCLNTKSMQQAMFEELVNNYKSEDLILIKYKIKPQTVLNLPQIVKEKSHYIIKFDMFSTHPELIKDADGKGKNIIEEWVVNVTKMDQKT
jgi:hypothetical protein